MTGRTISHYEILDKLGEGGMGIVYKARDKRLDRFVALKVLPADKVANPDRKRRFVQEAKAASALNNPHIITIYDIDEADGIDFIAMEFVPGKTLDQLISRKGLRLNETLKYAIQIADVLATAHAAGIVHRDLKPGNVMVTDSGSVKVLDFGLAKLTEQGGTTEFDRTETIGDRPETEDGMIVGTIAYMSPEQAEGKKVDARSDIFSFGSLLYEMLTGRRAFQGDSKVSTLAAILNREPEPMEQVPRDVVRIVQRCLRKDLDRRAQHMADLKLALEEVREESDSGSQAANPVTEQSRKALWVAAAIVLSAVAGAAFWFFQGNQAPAVALQAVPLTTYQGYESSPSFSPDGNQVAFSWNGESADNFDIYVKLIGSGRPLRLTSDPARDTTPAWSPDGRSIAFMRRNQLLLVPALGGSEREVMEFPPGSSRALSLGWSPDGKWLVVSIGESASKQASLYLVSVETGDRRQLTFPPATTTGDSSGTLSPDGRMIAFVRTVGGVGNDMYALSLARDFKGKGEPKRLTIDNRSIGGITWTADGREIVFSSNRDGTQSLWRVAVTGSQEPRRLAVGENAVHPSISRQGNRLVYSQSISDPNIWRVNLIDPLEKPTQIIASTRSERNAQYSLDGKHIAFVSNRSGNQEIWICDADGSNPSQLTSLGQSSGSPRWSPDSQRIAFDFNIGGRPQIYTVNSHGGQPRRVTESPGTDERPSWSHDGKWIYFSSNRSAGLYQVWKAPAAGGEATQVTRKGGYNPFDSGNGKIVYYTIRGIPSSLWKVPADGGEETRLLESVNMTNFSVTRDGIYFAAQQVLQHLSFTTGQVKAILTIERRMDYGLSVSPDEHWLLYTQIDQEGSDLMLVENFR